MPPTVRDAVLARLARLSPGARQVAGAVSVLGRRAEQALLAAVSGQPGELVDECLVRGMLVTVDGGVGFRHDLARLAVERSLAGAERSPAARAALAELTASGSADHRRLAHHAAGGGDRAAVARHAPLAAARAARLGAHREAAEHLRQALGCHEHAARGRAALLDQLSYECYLTDQADKALASGLEAMAICEQDGDAGAVGRAQRWLSRLSWVLGDNTECRALRRSGGRHPGAAAGRSRAGHGLQQPGPAPDGGRGRCRGGALGHPGPRAGP